MKERKLQIEKKRRLFLSIAIVIIAGFLVFTKCYSLAGWNISYFVIPVGISYYTFSIISYLADIYWKRDQAEKNYFKLALFVLYFPKVLQGPISRHKQLGPQLTEGHSFDYTNMCYGVQLMLWGYFKKMVIADRVAIVTGTILGDYTSYGGAVLLTGVVLASVQLYCDFSGYMDIARGVSQIFGINLDENFNHPFFSKSAAEFWRRWHITLGTWFKDYIYMPLVISPCMIKASAWFKKRCGNRVAKAVMAVVPLSVVWILTGLWHGTGIPYLVWGIYWGLLIIISTVFAPEIKKLNQFLHINTKSTSWARFQMVRTFLLFCFGRLLTVPGDLKVSWNILKTMVTSANIWQLADGTLYNLGLDTANFNLMTISVGVLWGVSILQKNGSLRKRISHWNLVFRWGFYVVAFVSVMLFGVYGSEYDASAFVYMNY